MGRIVSKRCPKIESLHMRKVKKKNDLYGNYKQVLPVFGQLDGLCGRASV